MPSLTDFLDVVISLSISVSCLPAGWVTDQVAHVFSISFSSFCVSLFLEGGRFWLKDGQL